MTESYIAIGSNLDPEKNIVTCAKLLRQHFSDCKFATVYRSPSLLDDGQDDYLNSVVKITTDASVYDVKDDLKKIETTLGKEVIYRWGPRTIDLDILLHGDEVIEKDLQVPHPRIQERSFVLVPLCELIDTSLLHPTLNKSWNDLLSAIDQSTIEVIDLVL